MKNKFLFILTKNLSFFYRINKALTENRIKFKILNFGMKIPNSPSIILTTYEEKDGFETKDNKIVILAYSRDEDFNEYILRVIAAFRIGFKEYYSKLTFSIDPGKRIGLMIFLDDFYLDSYCCYQRKELINEIRTHINLFQKNNPNLMKLIFKFGRGVISITFDLVEKIFNILQNRNNVSIFLIDEFKSSKIKINNQHSHPKISKDEAAALILALREGIEINQKNYLIIYKQLREKKMKNEEFRKKNYEEINKSIFTLKEIAEKVFNGELSLSDATEMMRTSKEI